MVKGMTDYKELAINCGHIALICEQNRAQKLADHERKCRDAIFELLSALHTIDPESLPVVRQLRAELEKVKAERDAAVKDIEAIMKNDDLCPIQCEWVQME